MPPPGVYAGYVAVNLMEIGILGQDEGQFESYKAYQLAFRTYRRAEWAWFGPYARSRPDLPRYQTGLKWC